MIYKCWLASVGWQVLKSGNFCTPIVYKAIRQRHRAPSSLSLFKDTPISLTQALMTNPTSPPIVVIIPALSHPSSYPNFIHPPIPVPPILPSLFSRSHLSSPTYSLLFIASLSLSPSSYHRKYLFNEIASRKYIQYPLRLFIHR